MPRQILTIIAGVFISTSAHAGDFTAHTWANCSAETSIFGVLLSNARDKGANYTLSDIEAADRDMERWIDRMTDFVGVHELPYLKTLFSTSIDQKSNALGLLIAQHGESREAWELAIDQASVRYNECMAILGTQ